MFSFHKTDEVLNLSNMAFQVETNQVFAYLLSACIVVGVLCEPTSWESKGFTLTQSFQEWSFISSAVL